MKSKSPAQALAFACSRHGLIAPLRTVEGVAESVVGLHNTSPVSPYLSLNARLVGFQRRNLEQAMWERWTMARIRAMRLTMFVLPVPLLEMAMAATHHLRESLTERWFQESGLSPAEYGRLSDAILDALSSGPLTVRALRKALAVPASIDIPGVVGRMCDMGVLAGGAPPRSWRSPFREYHRWTDVLPEVVPAHWNPQTAIAELIRRYVRSYGPVTIDDISWWTGIGKGRCRAVVEQLQGLEEVSVEGWPRPLLQEGQTSAPGDLDDAVRVLPLLDPYVQGYRNRERFLDPGRHRFVYNGGGNSAATLLWHGRIIGVWQPSDEPAESVRYHLFERMSASIRREAEGHLAIAAAVYFDHEVDVIECRTMKPLTAGGGRSASHPLDARVHRASRRTPSQTRQP